MNLRLIGRHLRGDFLTPLGKKVVCLLVGALCFIGALIVDDARMPLTLFGWALFGGFLISTWIAFDPIGDACDGSGRRLYHSPSGEVSIGVCHDCEGWLVAIRGDVKRKGRGRDGLLTALRELDEIHANALPEVAAELREAHDRIESFPPEDGLQREFTVVTAESPDEVMEAVKAAFDAIEQATETPVRLDPDDLERYREWLERQEQK